MLARRQKPPPSRLLNGATSIYSLPTNPPENLTQRYTAGDTHGKPQVLSGFLTQRRTLSLIASAPCSNICDWPEEILEHSSKLTGTLPSAPGCQQVTSIVKRGICCGLL